MKKEGRFFKDNLIVYVGAAIFFLLVISIGIIMYMTTSSDTKIGKESENSNSVVENKQDNTENTESASTSMGKTVEEQENNKSEDTNQNKATVKEDNTNTTSKSTSNKNTVNNKNANSTEKKENEKTANTNASSNKPEDNSTETKKEVSFIKPTEGEVICEFAKENLIYSETLKEWITHTAIDIKADKTSVIKAAADGTVKSIVNDPRYGLTVVIEHDDGFETVYSNLLTAEFVVEGEDVTQGQTIGTAGNTASFESNMESHLHFEVIKNGEYLDPTIYIK
ncbi:MAG: peptidoglycan DD-metalloendopeptidase family protein [Clostridia bacterium]|jgi:murein DD-endopeptidase MepM/ murein hydrolase activator NlpD|nr:peptidoglycan DD-metalloendopeptidase family protein [Clostridia bacterium]